ncbi:unnamed protein product [Clonostachys solani]|uniref:DUF3533 domain-containing protein n=1 Tax=Clonostachys solani TaxID=160281 RepID=A0A9N9YXC7_9HYPO|nr:unnamed protein product [Clonostachys solani]
MTSEPSKSRGPFTPALLIASIMTAVNIQLLLLAGMCYLYGTTFHQAYRYSNLDILAINLDQGDIGGALTLASSQFDGRYHLPTVKIGSSQDYPDLDSIRSSVCRADYWAAVVINSGSSDRFYGIMNGSMSTDEYDPAAAATFIYNQARHPNIADSVLLPGINALVKATTEVFSESSNAQSALMNLNTSNVLLPTIKTYLNPIEATADLIQPTLQPSRSFYNTVNMVIPPLAQFFFILALNGISMKMNFFSSASVFEVWAFRFCIGKIYTLISGLCMSAFIYAFRDSWAIGGAVFCKSWMLYWLLMDINWQVMETLIACYIPMQFSPFFVFPWIITNVASTVFPYEVMPAWYKIGYALPSSGVYTLLIHIWSGCGNQLGVALPVLFVWWALGHVTSVFAVRKRCADSAKEPWSSSDSN